VIVGYNRSAHEFAKTLDENPYYGFKCVGFIHETLIENNDIGPYLGTLDNLPVVINEQLVDEVVISQENNGKQVTKQCIEICDQLNIPVRIMPALQDLMHRTEEVDNLGLLSVINLNQLPLDKEENKIFKEVFDKLFAILFFILVGWWLFPIVIILIKLTSKGKVFYEQERWGLNNQPIICYKFRTMYELEEERPFEQTSKNDPRVTPIGKWFRKFSIDELPQFWNVLKGDMSVVGPRPHPTPMNIESMHRVANYMKRHMVKPGITGWAQINGRRGEVRSQEEMEDRVSFDLYYIHRWSFSLDLQIILQTIIKMLRDKGAY
jgi:putative colanic acid biosynthesis UDP-glucose lipid carrier transferase